MPFNANNKYGTQQLSEKYREHREAIEEIAKGEIGGFPEELAELLLVKSRHIQPLCKEILKIQEAGELQIALSSYLSSQIHMVMNRLFRSQQRKYELVIYDMLYRAYQSVLARGKGKKH